MITEYIDVAQVVLYLFWAFFAGLIYWLRLEDRREGYPLETDNPAMVLPRNILIPEPKTFLLMEGGSVEAPSFYRDNRPIEATRTATAAGSPLEPIGDPMLAGVGPGSFAERVDLPELTTHGADMIVPMRVATDFSITAGPDPRGWEIVAADGEVPGVVKEIWVDRSDYMVRYLEVELTDGAIRLVPVNMTIVNGESGKVEVASLTGRHFAHVPTTREPDRITLLEEDRICAFFAAGRLYATPRRLGPVV